MVILFHDVGNIKGRKGHNKEITKVYNAARKNEAKYRRERSLVIAAAKAHCGKAKDGSFDTLKEVDEIQDLDGEPVRLREIAAILRFADELAEGPTRTSQFMQECHKYDSKSMPFHEYANITNIFIDRGNGRIAVTYEIEVGSKAQVERLLKFTYGRIIKMDAERKYGKFYSNYLLPFKKTTVTINFSANGCQRDIGLEGVELKDAVPIPDGIKNISESFVKEYPSYEINKLINKLKIKKHGKKK